MIFFKACRKCGGDVGLHTDEFGPYAQCIQCGMLIELRRQPKPIQVNEPQLKLPLEGAA